jgi:hypothetical protein
MSTSSPANDANSRATTWSGQGAGPYGALRRFTRERESTHQPMEHCELCGEIIPAHHRHLLELSSRVLVCACQACSLLFSNQGAGGGKYLLVPQRYLALPDFYITDEQWDELMIPINMAFIFRSTGAKHVMAIYPSPAGAMESLLGLEGWEALARNNPTLNDLEPDVEALLVNRVKNAREYYVVPIDVCYQLIGLIRVSWKGLSGGQEVWEALEKFFGDLRAKSRSMRGDVESHASNDAITRFPITCPPDRVGVASSSRSGGMKGEPDGRPEL